jgi:DNA-binding protein HU-beta
MNRRELVAAIAAHTEQDPKAVDQTLRGFVDVVSATIKKGDPVVMSGFAKFVKVKRAARMARNPQTGEPVKVKASQKVRITPLKALKDVASGATPAPKLTKAPAKKAAASTARPRRTAAASTAASTATATKRATTKRAATKAPAKKATTRATATKAPAKKATARKTTAKATATKATATKATRATATKSTATKATTKRAAATRTARA